MSGYVQSSTPGLNTLYWTARQGNASSTYVAGTHHYIQFNDGPLIPLDDAAIAETDFSWTPIWTHDGTFGATTDTHTQLTPDLNLDDWSEIKWRIGNHGYGSAPPYHRDSETTSIRTSLIGELSGHSNTTPGRSHTMLVTVGDGDFRTLHGGNSDYYMESI